MRETAKIQRVYGRGEDSLLSLAETPISGRPTIEEPGLLLALVGAIGSYPRLDNHWAEAERTASSVSKQGRALNGKRPTAQGRFCRKGQEVAGLEFSTPGPMRGDGTLVLRRNRSPPEAL